MGRITVNGKPGNSGHCEFCSIVDRTMEFEFFYQLCLSFTDHFEKK